MSKKYEALWSRQENLRSQIIAALDLLQGTLHKSPSQGGYHLSTNADQRTRHRTKNKYVRKELLPQVSAMTRNHRTVRWLLRQLSEVNWRLLQLPPHDG